jgi:2-polyprenyl-6-methoxyphenol hydroxylase-like FAD-dependent oxidoreductase
MAAETIKTQCCVVGGGPAGMMLGFLLARAGVKVELLEKHADFLRDFRGDTIHPSTLEFMHELGLLDEFLKLPHEKALHLYGQVGDETFTVADFTHLPTHAKFVAVMPQWDFLNFLARQGARYPNFSLRQRAEATDLIAEEGRIVGVKATTPHGPIEIRADLVIGTDGRHSLVREKAGLQVEDLGAPMDVLWFRISRRKDDPAETMGRFNKGGMFVLINRGEHWQCGLVIAKGSIERIHAAGLPAFRADVAERCPFAADRIDEIRDWDDVKLLTVAVNRLPLWHKPGVLCIGDAAHTMSPVGGVGVNLAVQDAVAAANILAAPLRQGRTTEADLARVQRRRTFATRIIQRFQIVVQNRVVRSVLDSTGPLKPPFALRLLGSCPLLQRLPARLLGLGVRRERVAPEIANARPPAS